MLNDFHSGNMLARRLEFCNAKQFSQRKHVNKEVISQRKYARKDVEYRKSIQLKFFINIIDANYIALCCTTNIILIIHKDMKIKVNQHFKQYSDQENVFKMILLFNVLHPEKKKNTPCIFFKYIPVKNIPCKAWKYILLLIYHGNFHALIMMIVIIFLFDFELF